MDNYGSGSLYAKLSVDLSQRSYIWIRYYRRVLDETPTYLTINNIPYLIADVNETDLNAWKWERIGPVKFEGDSELSISRKYTEDPQSFMAIFIDSLMVTTDAEFSPETDLWKPVPQKIVSFEQPQSSGTVLLDFPPASYRCKVSVENEFPVVDVLGRTSTNLMSNSIELEIR